MKKTMFAVCAALVMAVAFTSCSGKKGEASSSKTDVSSPKTEASSTASSRKQIDAFFKDYEKFIEKAENAAKKGNISSLVSLEAEAVKLAEKSEDLQDVSDWTLEDSENLLKLTARYSEVILKLSSSAMDSLDSLKF